MSAGPAHLFRGAAGLQVRYEDTLSHFGVFALEDHDAKSLRALSDKRAGDQLGRWWPAEGSTMPWVESVPHRAT